MRKFIARVTFDLHGMTVNVSSMVKRRLCSTYGYIAMVLERSDPEPA